MGSRKTTTMTTTYLILFRPLSGYQPHRWHLSPSTLSTLSSRSQSWSACSHQLKLFTGIINISKRLLRIECNGLERTDMNHNISILLQYHFYHNSLLLSINILNYNNVHQYDPGIHNTHRISPCTPTFLSDLYIFLMLLEMKGRSMHDVYFATFQRNLFTRFIMEHLSLTFQTKISRTQNLLFRPPCS